MFRFRLLLIPALLCSAGALSSCGPTRLEQAQASLARGDLEAASALLEGETSYKADDLRERISHLAEDRRSAQVEVEECLALAESGGKREALKRLQRFKRDLKDRRAKDIVSQAESDIVDLVPGARLTRNSSRPVAVQPEPEPEPEPESQAPVVDLAERSADQARRAAERSEWKLALSLIEVALKRADGESQATLSELKNSFREGAASEAASKLERAQELERSAGLDAALRFARNAESNMPGEGVSPAIDALREYTKQAGGSVVASAARPTTVRLTPSRLTADSSSDSPAGSAAGASDSDSMNAMVAARRAEEEGRILEALDLYHTLTMELPVGSERDWAYERSLSLEDRAALREELSLAFAADPDAFLPWEVTSIDGDRITMQGEEQPFANISLKKLRPLVESLTLTSQARAGWFRERLSRDDKHALSDLGRAMEGGEVSKEHAWTIVAEARGEVRPAEGYLFESGEWHSSAEAAEEALAKEIATFERALARARTGEREAALKDMLRLGADGAEALKRALAAREEEALSTLTKGRVLAQLERLSDQRVELDSKREKALELIFDEEEYFYPYNPPECPPERAKLYPAVQRRVDELVAEVRSVWNASKSVRVTEKFMEGIAELDWLTSVRHQNGLDVPEYGSLPPWIEGLPRRADKVDLTNFGWNAKERKDLRYGRAVRKFNEAHWQTYEETEPYKTLGEITVPSSAEREQVRATNDYRLMFGRRPVAWNPVIQLAAQGHSDWMSLTGKYSHFNDEDPKLRGPGDRMRVAGYNRGISENLSRGNPGPRDAHDGWAHSSGHHRNLLMPGHREMASAIAGSLWTQNFGVDDAFREALEEWYD